MAWQRKLHIVRSREINLLALIKGEQRYMVFYEDGREADALCQLGRWMEDSRFDFTEHDARVMAAKIETTRDER